MKLQVALVCPYSIDHPGGVATHVLGLARWLGAQGLQVDVIAPGTPSGVTEAWRGVRVHRLGRAVGITFNGSTAHLALRPGQARRAIALTAAADVVVVHEPLTPGLAFAVARKAHRLITVHHAAFRPTAVQRPVLRLRSALLPARVTLAVSAEAAATATAVTSQAACIFPNAIDRPEAPPMRSGLRGGEAPRIGFLGRRDDARKGFALFVALARRPGLGNFEVAGPGAQTGSAVTDVGELTDAARLAWLQTVDVLIAPNLGGESFGLVLIEALAAGCDVVASDLPAFAAVLGQAGLGRTFARGDLAAAESTLREAIAQPVDPLHAHEATQAWGWDRVGPRFLAILERSNDGVVAPGS